MKILWNFIKDNLTVLLGICTAILAVVYAIFKLLINAYYSGYFKVLNIDLSYLKINYDDIVYQVVFVATFLIGIIYLMMCVDSMWEKKYSDLQKGKLSFLRKIKKGTKEAVICLVMAICLLSVLNIPLALVLCVRLQNTDSSGALFTVTGYLYVMEFLFYGICKLNKKEKKIKKL